MVLLILLMLPFLGKAQIQELGIPFQGVAKDYSGQFVNERTIYIELSIFSKDDPTRILFNELHQTKSDEWGLFSVLIGKGQSLSAVYARLSQMDWSYGNYHLQIKMAIVPEAPLGNWEYKQHLISLGTTPFGIVPYALYSIKSGTASGNLTDKLSISDTSQMLQSYLKKTESVDKATLDSLMRLKISMKDSGLTYITPTQFSITTNAELRKKLNIADSLLSYVTPTQLSTKTFDTVSLSNRINEREHLDNKSTDMNALADYTDQKYPSVKATKDYVDNQISMGAPDATINNRGILQLTGDLTGSSTDPRIASNAVTTSKVLDAAITDAKISTGIQASKVGLGNVSNHAQLYNLNGLTSQVQNFASPGSAGLSPNWSSVGSNHTLNLPMANASSVTAGLISKSEYDRFNTAATSNINTLTTTGNAGIAIVTGQNLNIPNYTIAGLSGTVNPNFILAGPSSGAAGAVQYRALVAADIPDHAANTTGNASTASQLQAARLINGVAFDGSQDIDIKARTINKLIFSVAGMGANGTEYFDGNSNKTISYNTIGAAPKFGSTDISTLGTITVGTWSGDVIGSTFGGAGTINGIMKANGVGVVTAASSVTDFQVPLTFATPLSNASNTISIHQANTNTDGYLSSADWNSFNNKISATEKASANGVATLNALGKIPTSQIPAISFSSGYVVSSQSAMLALSAAVVGSIAIRTDNSKNYVLSASDPAVLSNWLELLMPAAVSSVNGYTTGSITLTSSDIAEGTNLYFNNARVKSAVDAFLGGDAPINYNASTGKIGITQSATNANGYLSATDWNTFNNKQNTFGAQSANSFYAGPNGLSGTPSFRTILAADIPTLNQSTTGNAATATALLNARSINGVSFNGTADITIPSNTANAITFNNSGTGVASASSFNGSSPLTISYNTIGALPTIGANTITTLGTINTGTWNANIIGSNYGGAGTNSGILKANGAGVVSAAVVGTDYESPLSFTSPLIRTTNAISIQTATTSSSGILTSSDWQLFNNKQATIVAGTGVGITGGNTINIGQAVSTASSPSFAGMTLSGLSVSGLVANSAAGVLSSVGITGTGLVVKENTPTLITPILGVASATSLNVGTITATSAIVSNGDISAKRFKLTMPSAITAAATTTIDMSTGNVFTVNLAANITTLTLTNAGVGTYLIKFAQTVGSKTVTFPLGWRWAGGITPTITSTLNKLDIVTLIFDGTTYYATIVQNF
ncbi:MAG: hypothetical protein KA534_02785 [Sediminibacterium sp.]|nr:hypothetical protein [Sediminibacterium sp.]